MGISSVSGMGVYCSDHPQENLLGGRELADSLQPRHLWNLQQWLYHSHAFPVLLPVNDCRHGRAKPSCCSNVQCLLCSSPLAQLRLSQPELKSEASSAQSSFLLPLLLQVSELYYRLRLSHLPFPSPTFPLPFILHRRFPQ